MGTLLATPPATAATKLDKLSVFAFLWASQALVHHEFYSKWVLDHDPWGWILAAAALMLLLFPRSTSLLAATAVASVAFNVNRWPAEINHILVESLLHMLVLGAIVSEGLAAGTGLNDLPRRNAILARFRPVAMAMLVIVYYFAFVAKLNVDFFDPEVSCVAALYKDLFRRLPFLPTDQTTMVVSIWATLAIEAALPLLLTFRRTQGLAVLLGVGFHLLLGLIGHRTFSALAFALYSLFLIDSLTEVIHQGHAFLVRKCGSRNLTKLLIGVRTTVAVAVPLLILAKLTGHYRSDVGPLVVYRVAWVVWIAWSLALGLTYSRAVFFANAQAPIAAVDQPPSPGWLWIFVAVTLFNGSSQYVGLKTETCFTMYSNLRTEGGHNNHLFIPVIRVADFQDDLVAIVETNHASLRKYVDEPWLITHFELRRIVSSSPQDFYVKYVRDEEERTFQRVDGVASDAALAAKHPWWQEKWLYFRPVSTGEKACCQH